MICYKLENWVHFTLMLSSPWSIKILPQLNTILFHCNLFFYRDIFVRISLIIEWKVDFLRFFPIPYKYTKFCHLSTTEISLIYEWLIFFCGLLNRKCSFTYLFFRLYAKLFYYAYIVKIQLSSFIVDNVYFF